MVYSARIRCSNNRPTVVQLLTGKERCLVSIPVEQLAALIDLLQEIYLELHGCYRR